MTSASGFFQKRFDPQEKYGLTLTIGFVLTLVFGWFFYVIAEDFFNHEIFFHSDLRVLSLVSLYRAPALNQVMLAITYLGKWQVVFLGVLFLAIIFALQKKWLYFWAIIISTTGGQILVTLVKNFFHRSRPPLTNALVIETSYSFPSGHSVVAMTFYGFLTFIIFISLKSKLARFFTAIVGLTVILAIGFSRVYLGVHYPSDVFAGYLLGATWITVIVTAVLILRKDGKERKTLVGPIEIIIIGTFFFAVWLGYWIYYTRSHPLPTNLPKPQTINLSNNQIPADLFLNLPKTSETLTGQPMEPINIIVIGNKSELDKAFSEAGWYPTDPVTLRSSLLIAYKVVASQPYPNAPGTPSFWDYMPNEFAYELPTGNNPGQRYHIHFWQTPFTVNGTPVWFATAHFDKSVFFKDYIIPTHQIDPNVDAQRAKVLTDLSKTAEYSSSQEFQLVSPLQGKNAAGSLFYTDGKAETIYLK